MGAGASRRRGDARGVRAVSKDGLSTSALKKRQRASLFAKQKGLCYWCKGRMVMPDPTRIRRHRALPGNLATIDHLDHKFSPERGKHPGEYRRVLACKRCNELRGQLMQQMQPIEFLRAQAKGSRRETSSTDSSP